MNTFPRRHPKIKWLVSVLTLLTLALVGCFPRKPLPPSPRPTAGSPLPTPSAAPCELLTRQETTAYIAPGHAPIPAHLETGTRLQVVARTADGWLGCEVGYAHAAAVGLLRLWWIPPDRARLEGDCASLPVVEAPRPDRYCYEMAMYDLPLRSAPDETADVVAVLQSDTYAILLGFSPDGKWGLLTLDDGTEAWFDLQALNITGACENLPTITPSAPTPP